MTDDAEEIARGLSCRNRALTDQLHRLKLKLPLQFHLCVATSGFIKHLISVFIKPAAAQTSGSMRIPIYSGRVFRLEAGHRSDLKSAAIPK
jgi:hypothetical protein